MEAKIHDVEDFILYYALTENLLTQFRAIAPELYNEIDSIKDKQGRPTNIFIKFIPRANSFFKYPGTTCLDHSEEDNDAYYSEYGINTVSVRIWIMDNALKILSHELGHVKYQVPNLQNYIKYYKLTYGTNNKQDYLGHKPSDLSGRSAGRYEKIFSKNYQIFLREHKLPSPLAMLKEIRKKGSALKSL